MFRKKNAFFHQMHARLTANLDVEARSSILILKNETNTLKAGIFFLV